MADACTFCAIVERVEPAVMVREWPDAVAFLPLRPATDGHVLVVPKRHVRDALTDPDVTAAVMRRAAQFATPPCNLITSCGPAATQTIMHLHVHVVPRAPGDGLSLPWGDD